MTWLASQPCPDCENGWKYEVDREIVWKVPCLLCMGDGTIEAKPNPLHHNGVYTLTGAQRAAWMACGYKATDLPV
jgi:hypothetical protein